MCWYGLDGPKGPFLYLSLYESFSTAGTRWPFLVVMNVSSSYDEPANDALAWKKWEVVQSFTNEGLKWATRPVRAIEQNPENSLTSIISKHHCPSLEGK